MPLIDVDLNAVKEKPLMPAGQMFTFQIISALPEQAKNPNKKSGKHEWQVATGFKPLDVGWEDRELKHWWSLSEGALSSPDPTFSIKKFFEIVGFPWSSDGKFNTDDMQIIRFIGTLKYGKDRPTLPVLATIVSKA